MISPTRIPARSGEATGNKDKKDTSEIAPQRSGAVAEIIPIRPVAKEEAVESIPTANSPHYLEALRWIDSDESPEVTDPTWREVLPQLAAQLRDRFNLSLSETVELLRYVDCEIRPALAEIEQIAEETYSSGRKVTAARPGKRYASELEAALDHPAHETLPSSSKASEPPKQHDTDAAIEFLSDLDPDGAPRFNGDRSRHGKA